MGGWVWVGGGGDGWVGGWVGACVRACVWVGGWVVKMKRTWAVVSACMLPPLWDSRWALTGSQTPPLPPPPYRHPNPPNPVANPNRAKPPRQRVGLHLHLEGGAAVA